MAADRNKATGELTFPDLVEKDCLVWSDRWDKMHPETARFHKFAHDMYREYGFVGIPILDARKRFYPGGADEDEKSIPNLLIQGFAASLANRALLIIADALGFRKLSYWSGLVFQVHDFIGVQVPFAHAYWAKKVIEESMKYNWRDVAFTATAEISFNFGQQ